MHPIEQILSGPEETAADWKASQSARQLVHARRRSNTYQTAEPSDVVFIVAGIAAAFFFGLITVFTVAML